LTDRFGRWLSGFNPKTAKPYGGYLRRLLKLANLSPDEALEKTKKDVQTYIALVILSNKFLRRKGSTVSGELTPRIS